MNGDLPHQVEIGRVLSLSPKDDWQSTAPALNGKLELHRFREATEIEIKHSSNAAELAICESNNDFSPTQSLYKVTRYISPNLTSVETR